jgi:hypothetical protein
MTRKAMQNAVRTMLALSGSTNSVPLYWTFLPAAFAPHRSQSLNPAKGNIHLLYPIIFFKTLSNH